MSQVDSEHFGDRVLRDLELEVGVADSYVEAMMRLVDERMDLMAAGIRFCAGELVSKDNESARAFLLRLADGAEASMNQARRKM